jgi:hypothetical protein
MLLRARVARIGTGLRAPGAAMARGCTPGTSHAGAAAPGRATQGKREGEERREERGSSPWARQTAATAHRDPT